MEIWKLGPVAKPERPSFDSRRRYTLQKVSGRAIVPLQLSAPTDLNAAAGRFPPSAVMSAGGHLTRANFVSCVQRGKPPCFSGTAEYIAINDG